MWVDAGGPQPAQDLRHRRAPQGRPHDARLRPQRRHRHDLPARAHRGVRHRRPAGHVAAPRRASTSTMREVVDVLARLAGERWGHGRLERQDVAWRHRPEDLSLFSRRRMPAPGDVVRPDGRHAGAPDVASRRSGRRRRAVDRHPQAGLAAPEGPPQARGARPEADDPRARPGHRVRGRRVPEPVGVLGRRHGDVHGARRSVHAGVRLLPRRHAQAGGAGGRRAGAGGRGDRPDGPRPRRADDGRPRRPRRRRDGPRRGVRRGDPPRGVRRRESRR